MISHSYLISRFWMNSLINVTDVWPLTKPIVDAMKDVKGMEKLTKQQVEVSIFISSDPVCS